MLEQAVTFKSRDRQLVAIEHLPQQNKSSNLKFNKGVVIVVGGPQTRVGSHRLFVHLARELADVGINVFRFDYTGAGDSEGDVTDFTNIQADIEAAIHCFSQRNEHITELSLWGLCDAASAILLYLQQHSYKHQNIVNLFLVNPWVRQEHTQAKAYLRSYYLKRFFSKEFWNKLLSGKVKGQMALSDIQGFHQQSKKNQSNHTSASFVSTMLLGLKCFSGQVDIVLSGNDLTADEFKILVKNDKDWQALMAQPSIKQHIIEHADHTFSHQSTQKKLISLCCSTLTRLKS